MKLKFIGTDGSMDLRQGGIYDVEILSHEQYFIVTWKKGGAIRRCPYSSLIKLCENWADLN